MSAVINITVSRITAFEVGSPEWMKDRPEYKRHPLGFYAMCLPFRTISSAAVLCYMTQAG